MTVTGRTPVVPSDHLQPLLMLLRGSIRFWRIALLAVVIAVAATAVFARLRPKQYRSEAAVYYREGLQWTASEGGASRRVGHRLREMLLARAQLAKVIEELELYPELVGAGRMADAVEEMRLATTFRGEQTDVFNISYVGRTPAEAQRVTARLTEVLIDENGRLRTEQAELARQFLATEKARNEAELAAKEGEQLRFLARHPEFAQEPGTATTTIGATLRARPAAAAPRRAGAPEDGALAALRREEERLRRQLSSPGEIPPPPQDAALVAARADAELKVTTARRALAERRAQFTEQHPDVRAASARLSEAEEAYRRASAALSAATAPAPRAELEQRLAQVQREIAEHRGAHPQGRATRVEPVETSEAAKRVVALEADWARLNREVAEARERLQQLDTRQFMASMTASMATHGQTSQFVLIDPAFLPAQPLGWGTKKMLAFGAAVGVMLGAGLALVLALLDDVVRSRYHVERLQIAPVLSEIPRRTRRPWRRGRGKQLPGERNPNTRTFAPAPERGEELGASPEALIPATLRAPAGELAESASTGSELVAASAERVDGNLALVARNTAVPGQGLRIRDERPALSRRVHVHTLAGASDLRPTLFAAPDSATASSFRVLRHRLAERGDPRVVLVTSASPGEGKTFCAANLARALLESARARVLLLEADLHTPALARLLGFEPPSCVSEQLQRRDVDPSRSWSVVELLPSFHVAAVSPAGVSRSLLDGPGLAMALADLRQVGYDYVVVDGPPILVGADANLLEEHVDVILMTMSSGASRASAFRKAVEQVGNGKILGVALLGPE